MAKSNQVSLFVFIDAFGWELLRRHSFLDDILTHKSPLETILGYSSTCDPTILTGKMPCDHDHFAFYAFAPEKSPFRFCRWLRFLPKSITGRGRVRHWISRILKKVLGYTGYFQIYSMPFELMPLFDYTEKRDLYQPGGINSGVSTIFDHLRGNHIPFFLSDWRAPEVPNIEALKAALPESNIRFAYLFLAHMDAVLHEYGTYAPEAHDKIAWYDQQLREVYRTACEYYENVHLFCFSDHGMTDIHTICNLIPKVETAGFEFGTDYAAVYDSTIARFWFMNEKAKTKIIEILEHEPLGRVLTQKDLEAYGCNFKGERYGNIFFLMNPGVLICPSFLGEKPLAGMHGYEPTDKDSLAMFASNSQPEVVPKRLDDLYRLMLHEVS